MAESGIGARASRSGQDRRGGQERRAVDRRRSALAVDVERRRSGVDRRGSGRRVHGERRRSWGDRRTSDAARRSLQPGPASRLSSRDRQRARDLPVEFIASSGTAVIRVTKLIRRHWTSYPMPARADLAGRLLPLLEPLANGSSVTEELRKQCEAAVEDWQSNVSTRLSK